MVAIWSEPDSLFSQGKLGFKQTPGFVVGAPFPGSVPSYGKEKPAKLPANTKPLPDITKLPFPTIGTDFSTGARDIDIQSGIESAIPKLSPEYQGLYNFYQIMAPQRQAEMEQAARLSQKLTREQLATLYPYLSAAGAESTARNLAASQAFLGYKEQMPSNVQNIMASKQGQMLMAQQGEAAMMAAVADQARAAKDFAGKYAGKYVQYG